MHIFDKKDVTANVTYDSFVLASRGTTKKRYQFDRVAKPKQNKLNSICWPCNGRVCGILSEGFII